jgi:hypothetical protein
VCAGYPRLLSGDLAPINLTSIPETKQKIYFPEVEKDKLWERPDHVKRYYLNFPFYPFRTLCPRDMKLSLKSNQEFDPTSPLFPANTQLNIVFTKRKENNFLSYMLPFQLDSTLGSSTNTLTAIERAAATTFRVTTVNPVASADYQITRVDISIKDMYLQVHKCRKDVVFLVFLQLNVI